MQTTDAQLLQGFSQHADETCFEELVRRYSSLVMGVCHRILQNTADAEEAFQNTFLILARKAPSLSGEGTIGAWIHEVAFRSSLKIRHSHLAQGKKHAAFHAQCDIENQETHQQWDELRVVIDEELNHIVEKYRLPLIACYLEGKDADEAAEQCKLNPNTFRVRLMRGKDLLKKRLSRRGVALSAATVAALLAQKGSVVASESLIETTLQAVNNVSLEGASAGTIGFTAIRLLLSKKALVVSGLVVTALLMSLVIFSPSNALRKVVDREVTGADGTVKRAVPAKEIVDSGVVSEGVEYPTSVQDYLNRLDLALKQPKPLRWKLIRRLGINLTDANLDDIESYVLPEWTSNSENITHPIKHPNFHSSLFYNWSRVHPRAPVEWTSRLLNFPSHHLPEAFHTGGLHPSYDQRWLFEWMLTQWVKIDSRAALEWSSKHLNREHRLMGVSIALRQVAKEDSRAAFNFLRTEPAGLQLLNEHSLLSALISSDHAEVGGWIQQIQRETSTEKEANKMIPKAANMLAIKDSRFALEWALGLSQSNEANKNLRDSVIQKIAEDWAAKNPVAAMTWLEKMSDNSEKERIVDAMIISQVRSLSRDHAGTFSDFVKSVEELPKNYHERALCELVRARRTNQDKQVYDWIQSQTQVSLKDVLWSAYLTSNRDSFSRAMEIAEQIQNSNVKFAAQQSLIKRASELEVSAQHVLQSSLPQDKKDLALSQVCSSKQMNPRSAVLLAEKIHHPKTKNAVLTVVIQDWMTQDRTAAVEWVHQSSLSQEIKESLVGSH